MTLNVDYDLTDIDSSGPWVRKALPEGWRLKSELLDEAGNPFPSESDSEMAERCGALFGFLPGWTVHRDAEGNLALYDVPPDPPPPPSREDILAGQVATLAQQVTELATKVNAGNAVVPVGGK